MCDPLLLVVGGILIVGVVKTVTCTYSNLLKMIAELLPRMTPTTLTHDHTAEFLQE